MHLTYVGHGTVLLETEGVRVLTDPLLRRHLGPLIRRAPLPDLDDVRHVDVLLISHLHIDHLDAPSLRRLDKSASVVVPAHGVKLMRRLGFDDVQSLSPGESLEVRGLRVEATAAYHAGKRYPVTKPGDALGYLIGKEPSVYFAGDTGLFPEMAALAGRIDIALLPVSGWGFTLPDDHLSPLTGARALALLRPRLAVPVHWGTYFALGMVALQPGHEGQPAHAFARYAGLLAPSVEVRVLEPGERAELA